MPTRKDASMHRSSNHATPTIRLGINKGPAFYRRGVELPSDLQGLHYTEFSNIADVRLRIVQELKSAGIQVDANRAF
jgi:hypothetical protein